MKAIPRLEDDGSPAYEMEPETSQDLYAIAVVHVLSELKRMAEDASTEADKPALLGAHSRLEYTFQDITAPFTAALDAAEKVQRESAN